MNQIFLYAKVFKKLLKKAFFTLILGSLNFVFSKEIILISSLILISILIRLLIKTMNNLQQRTIIGTAVIIFVFRSMPSPGAGLNWFEIDILGFEHKTDLKEGLRQMWDWAKKQPMKERFVWDNYELDKGIYSFWKTK